MQNLKFWNTLYIFDNEIYLFIYIFSVSLSQLWSVVTDFSPTHNLNPTHTLMSKFLKKKTAF